jgi:hypothetical protein
VVLVVVATTLLASCRKPETPIAQAHVVNLAMNGVTLGDERVTITFEDQRETAEIQTAFSGPPVVRLRGRLVIERGRPVSLRVSGESPPSLPSEADVTATPDRTDTFLLRSPMPVHVVAALVRRAMVGGRGSFRLLPEGRADVRPCEGITGPFPDATCHAVSGLGSGLALVWLDRRQVLAAAAIETPWGVVVATTPERDASRAALVERFDVYSARR